MRTNIALDASLVEQAKALTGIKTTRAVIDEALRLLVQLRRQSEVNELFGQLRWEGDLNAMREGRALYDVTLDSEADVETRGEPEN